VTDSPISVLLVDDHDVVRSALETLVEFTPGLELWGAATSGADALARLDEATVQPDVVVSDVAMPGMSGVELAAAVRSRWPTLPCLMVSGHHPALYAEKARAAGAAGYVEKGDPSEIVDAIRRAFANDGTWLGGEA
jgi:DNA-binding NarL/FixJ family response regulator